MTDFQITNYDVSHRYDPATGWASTTEAALTADLGDPEATAWTIRVESTTAPTHPTTPHLVTISPTRAADALLVALGESTAVSAQMIDRAREAAAEIHHITEGAGITDSREVSVRFLDRVSDLLDRIADGSN